MKRIGLILCFFVMGCVGVLAQQSAQYMSAYECARYGRQLFDKGLYEEALPYVQKAAEAGYADAHLMAGWMFCNGKGVQLNYNVAMREYNKGAMKGGVLGAICFNNMGTMYEGGKGVEKNPKVAFNLYKKAAEMDPIGYKNMGRCYEFGIGVEADEGEAIKNYNEAIKKGNQQIKDSCNEGLERINQKRKAKRLKENFENTQPGKSILNISCSPSVLAKSGVIERNRYCGDEEIFIADFGLTSGEWTYWGDLPRTSNEYCGVECLLFVFNGNEMSGSELQEMKDFYDKYRNAEMTTYVEKKCSKYSYDKFSYSNKVSPFMKIIEVSHNTDSSEARPWTQVVAEDYYKGYDGYKDYYCREEFGVGYYVVYDDDGEKAGEVRWEEFAVLVDKNGVILWRGNLFLKGSVGRPVMNPELVQLWDVKHKACMNRVIRQAVKEYNVFKYGFPNLPVYISNFDGGRYEMKLYGDPDFFVNNYKFSCYNKKDEKGYRDERDISLTFSFTKEDFTEAQLNWMKKKAYEQFATTAPYVYRFALDYNWGLRYSGKRMVYNPETCAWISTDEGEKFKDYMGEYDLAKRYKKSPIIRNRLYFFNDNSNVPYEKELQGGDEEKDIITVRICPTKELCAKYLEMYPQGKYFEMVLEMYRYYQKGKFDHEKD